MQTGHIVAKFYNTRKAAEEAAEGLAQEAGLYSHKIVRHGSRQYEIVALVSHFDGAKAVLKERFSARFCTIEGKR